MTTGITKPRVVFEVGGDFGNAGGGRTLGVFGTEAEAEAAARGCGSCDCGGDGAVRRRLAVDAGGGRLYLLDGDRAWALGEMDESEAKALHGGESELVLLSVRNKAATVRLLRDLLPATLPDAKRMADGVPCVVGRFARGDGSALADALREAGDAVEMRAAGRRA